MARLNQGHNVKKLIVALFGAFVAYNANAGCENPAPGYDQTYCMAKMFIESDNELNAAYKNLSSLLKPDQKKRLVSAQRNWIKYRNANCSDNGTIDVSCNYDVNKKRTKFILDRTTECKIGSCKEQTLYNEDWEKQ